MLKKEVEEEQKNLLPTHAFTFHRHSVIMSRLIKFGSSFRPLR